MVKIGFYLKAECENLIELEPSEASIYIWNFKFKCNRCHETTDKFVGVDPQLVSEKSGSKGEANLIMKCKFCSREGSVSLIGPVTAFSPTAKNDGYQLMVTLDCQNWEPVDFDPQGEWVGKSEDESTKFEDIELGEDEWMDVDNNDVPATVGNLSYRFLKITK
ncbi:hypothetical protein H4219_003298 [Mycoemilia scoparia]|uniref:DUF866 domain-containing protein n=1 Tax=Mycoemilia scoparia TaxID=417184 RepID=A0A9W8DSV2_9FUNG|nr:hypothetical protein H4219_003298 [Mycoemilia scoparia]